MKALGGLCLAAALLLLGSAAIAQVPNPLIVVDEHGNGTLTFPGGLPIPTQGVLLPDPGPGGLTSVLTYNLLGPPSLTAGDVLLTDADEGGAFLDVLRFNPAGTGGDPAYPASLLFYSDNVGGADALADTAGPPSAFYTNLVRIPEVGPEGNNGAFYTPIDGQPGFVPGFAVTYHFVSDSVPEPSSLALLAGSAIAGLFASRRLRRR